MLSMIAAIGKNRELGQTKSATGLPWNIPEDTRYFRDTTRGHCVIMGQKTFEALGRPLPNRTNIVLTQDPNFSPEGAAVAHSPEEALQKAIETIHVGNHHHPVASRHPSKGGESDPEIPLCGGVPSLRGGVVSEEIFIIGGATIYSLFLPKADRLYLTHINAEFPDADVFFPAYESVFTKIVSERKSQDEHFSYTFSVLERE